MLFPLRYLKYIGGLIGLFMGGFWGLLLGYFGGNIVAGLVSARNAGAFANPQQRQRQSEVFVTTVFTLMGALAKSDKRISETEIAQTEQYMTTMGIVGEQRKQAVGYFKTGSSPGFNIDQALDAFIAVCGRSAKLKHLLLVYLIGLAVADGDMHAAEDQLLRSIAAKLGYGTGSYEVLLSMVLGQSRFSQGAGYGQGGSSQQGPQPGRRASSRSQLQAAYQALGVKASDSNASIKRAYRKLISEYHPDKLIGQGVPAEMVKVATERTQEIQAAYQAIENHRKK